MKKDPKAQRKYRAPYDDVWAANRKRYRKTLVGTRLTVDPETGYLSPVSKIGFTAQDRKLVVERFRLCSSLQAVADSIPVDIQSIYDAIAVDLKFRADINQCLMLDNRSMKLNDAIVEAKNNEGNAIILDLLKRAEQYGK